RRDRIPAPEQCAAAHVEGAYGPAGDVDPSVVDDHGAGDDPVAQDHRRRRDAVVALAHLAQAGPQVDLAVFTEVVAALARARVDLDEPRVDRAHHEAPSADGTFGRARVDPRRDAPAVDHVGVLRIDLRVELPALRPGLGIERDDLVVGRAEIQG